MNSLLALRAASFLLVALSISACNLLIFFFTDSSSLSSLSSLSSPLLALRSRFLPANFLVEPLALRDFSLVLEEGTPFEALLVERKRRAVEMGDGDMVAELVWGEEEEGLER